MASGLITKNTDLKSLKYGSMPLGSDKPYVTKNIGQAPGSQIGSQISHRIDDTSRIAQMLVGKPGIKYLLHEAELQQIGVGQRIKKAQQGGKSLFGAVLGQVGSTVVTTAKIVGSTLAQVPVNGTGTHFLKAFRTDTYLQPSGGNTASAFAQFFGAGGVEGAPLALQGKPIEGIVKESNFGTQKNSTYLVDSKTTAKLGYSGNVFNGKELKDYDEVKNRALPTDQYKIAKDYAKLGKIIPINSASLSSKDPLAKTKLQQSKAGTKQIGTITILEAGAPTALGGKPLFDYKNTTTGTSTEDAIRNAQVGAPIKVVASGSLQKDTTVTSTTVDSLIKSTSNQDVTGTLEDNGNSKLQQTYTNVKDRSYTKHTTEENIGSVFTANPIPTGVKPPSNEIQHTFDSIAAASSASIDNHKSQHNPELGRIYKEGDTYLQEQANRLIGKSTKPTQKETRVGLGDQGRTTKAYVNYWTPAKPDERDQVNMLDVGDRQDAAQGARDMAKFYFEIITPDGSKFLYFRAHIKNLDDGFNADWQARKYNGRAENFYTYGGFDRDINISFTIAAATRSEMKPLYRKMIYLASSTAPTYGTSGLMRGTLARITVGSYLDQIPGVITSVKYTISNEVPWEIAMGQPEELEGDVQVLPMVMECSISFKPIHDFAPQTGLYPYFTDSHGGSKFVDGDDTDTDKVPIKTDIKKKREEEQQIQDSIVIDQDNQKKKEAASKKAVLTKPSQPSQGFDRGFGGGGFSGGGSGGSF
jgi:hypothetical protein